MILYLAIDTSGSMVESDKRLIARSVALAISQYCRLGYANVTVRLLAAGEAPRTVEWNDGDEYPVELLNCSGKIDMQSLFGQLELKDNKLIFVTDGVWDAIEKKSFETMAGSSPKDSLRIIKVGLEPSHLLQSCKLRKIVFDAEEFLEALDGWIDMPADNGGEVDEW